MPALARGWSRRRVLPLARAAAPGRGPQRGSRRGGGEMGAGVGRGPRAAGGGGEGGVGTTWLRVAAVVCFRGAPAGGGRPRRRGGRAVLCHREEKLPYHAPHPTNQHPPPH